MGIIRSFTLVILIGIAVVGLTVTSANASLIYLVNRTVGAGSVSGFIETDGTLGVLQTGNIIDWVLTLTADNLVGGSPDVIRRADDGSVTTISGGATTATLTELIFDFDRFQGSARFSSYKGAPVIIIVWRRKVAR